MHTVTERNFKAIQTYPISDWFSSYKVVIIYFFKSLEGSFKMLHFVSFTGSECATGTHGPSFTVRCHEVA